MNLPDSIRITDVGPRDGLQNESTVLPVEAKVALVNTLARAGVAEVEVSSFVSPKWVPQLGDAADVFARIERIEDVVYSALVPNERGMERALEAHAAGKLDKIAVFTAASETFARKNTNASIAETIARFRPVAAQARRAGLAVRAYVSCVVACPYEGPITPDAVRAVTEQLLDIGADEIDLGETIGVAAPSDIDALYDGLDGVLAPADSTLHLHDTRGGALACAMRALQLGVRSFDGSCGGLGGCPYAPGAAGNLATEDLVYMAERMGIRTGVDLGRLVDAGAQIGAALGRELPGRVLRASIACASES